MNVVGKIKEDLLDGRIESKVRKLQQYYDEDMDESEDDSENEDD